MMNSISPKIKSSLEQNENFGVQDNLKYKENGAKDMKKMIDVSLVGRFLG